MKRLLSWLASVTVLPREISVFEGAYLARVNRLTMQFFWLHVPVFAAIAWANDTGPLLALILTTAVAIGPWVAHRSLSNPRTVTLVYGFAAMLMGGLLVHFGQGPVQIEMHFYFFALLAMLALYGNPMAILVAAVTVALHHLLLWVYLPASVFNYDAEWWVVAVHAAFVVLESIATVYIARSFFDNVIGLEKIVRQRTLELDERNRAMRLVLDNVDEGLITIDREGCVLPEHSAALTRWFGAPKDSQSLVDYLSEIDSDLGDAFALSWEQCLEGFLPIDLCVSQAPATLTWNGRQFRFSYRPLLDGDDVLTGMLVIVSDMTAEVERQRLECEQKETLSVLDRIVADKIGFLEFLSEAEDILETISDPPPDGALVVKRALHTLKGNCMTLGVQTIAELVHEIESAMFADQRPPTNEEVAELRAAWKSLEGRLSTLLGEEMRKSIEIAPNQLQELLRASLDGLPHAELARMIADLRLEPTAGRLRRAGEQAKRIAKRLNKEHVAVEIDDAHLRLDPDQWSSFWSAFIHVVRNALDHGVEAQDTGEPGKKGRGALKLRTFLDGTDFVVSIQDDGRGIAWEKVRQRAREALLACESRDDLIAAMFTDGISTVDEVTEHSGRGVGLAAIRTACEARGGRIEVESEPGCGTTFSFRFPRESMSAAPEEYLLATTARCEGKAA
jgi:two-component system chemotaxis sensor kinase CheA